MDEMNYGLYKKFSKLQWLWHKQQLRGYAVGGPMADPTRGQGRILAVLKMQDGVSTKDLSYLLGIRVSSLNELLAKLEKNGYIIREPSTADKRIMLVRLTEKGKDERQQEADTGDYFSCLTGEEQKKLEEYLDRVIATLEAEVGDGSDDEFERMRAAREHMGEEIFSRLASHIHGGHPFPDGCDPRGGFNHDRHGGFNGFRRGPHFGGDPRHWGKDKDGEE